MLEKGEVPPQLVIRCRFLSSVPGIHTSSCGIYWKRPWTTEFTIGCVHSGILESPQPTPHWKSLGLFTSIQHRDLYAAPCNRFFSFLFCLFCHSFFSATFSPMYPANHNYIAYIISAALLLQAPIHKQSQFFHPQFLFEPPLHSHYLNAGPSNPDDYDSFSSAHV